MRPFPVSDRWCVHSYYTVCPWAPDDSGRLLLAGANLDCGTGEVMVLSAAGDVLDRFGENPLHSGFYHTGLWQTWSPDARFVYYQHGPINAPQIVRRELDSGEEITIDGDIEGAPPDGEPLLSGLMGMLYAAGYGTGVYDPNLAPARFQAREEHGLFQYAFEPPKRTLRLSVAELLERHPQRDALLHAERELKTHLGPAEGLTLMTYCVRWAPSGQRFLFYFGNHNVIKQRGEPRLAYVFTASRDLQEIHLALDLSFGRPGVHWCWHSDGEHLIGYGPDPDSEARLCLAQVRFDGSDYRRLSRHDSGGHVSVSPGDHDLVVTDDTRRQPGEVLFINTRRDEVVQRYDLSRVYGEIEPSGRNPYRVCHHPVFDRTGRKVLANTLSSRHAVLCELDAPGSSLA